MGGWVCDKHVYPLCVCVCPGVGFRGTFGVLYPAVSMHSPGEKVKVNFTGPFQFDIKAYNAVRYNAASHYLPVHDVELVYAGTVIRYREQMGVEHTAPLTHEGTHRHTLI